ncbi:MAG: beta-ketoacyl synthase chain length factor [Parvibaculaceae bacterium]
MPSVLRHEERASLISTIYVESWAAFFSQGPDAEPRRLGLCKDDSVIPAGHRRRLGAYSRMAVSCGLSVTGAEGSDLVFCSRYGDVDLAFGLLKSLAVDELMSPAAFSLSVHNAAPGVMDLVRKSRVGHTAIAAGIESLSAGIAEAYAKLAARPEQTITFVFAEGEVPEQLKPFADEKRFGQALAMGLSARPSENTLFQIVLCKPDETAEVLASPPSEILAARMTSVLEGQSSELCWRSRGLSWSLTHFVDADV